MSSTVLDVHALGINFAGLQALDEFNIQVKDGEIVGLIGPNGAGKTTVFNLLTNVYRPTRGSITLKEHDTSGLSVHETARSGIARTFQNIRLFKELPVIDNILIALNKPANAGWLETLLRKFGFFRLSTSEGMSYSWLDAMLRLPRYWKEEKKAREKAMQLLSVFHMEDLADAPAGSLPYGAQRRLEILRALATNPRVLLLDEPAAGMNPSETAELLPTLREIRDRFGVAIILIEHDMSLVMNICERIIVLNYGLIIAEGMPEEIRSNPMVIEAYLGQQRGE
ncbi:MAG: ABC transporter ATP-binding protein [Clostridia bacterium]|nr:ABC transporter ATP-binding protein [Clostridia bacterium]